MTSTGKPRNPGTGGRVNTGARPANSDGDARLVAVVWLGSRMLIAIVALVVMLQTGRPLEALMSNWDAQHYFDIASHGYANPLDVAFFPGLPLLLKTVSLTGFPMWLGGVALSLVSSGLATWALFRMLGVAPACLWTIAPMAVFTAVPYTEAPFCAAAFWAWERARAGRWGHAAGLAALACTLRISGLFLVFGLAVLALTQASKQFRQRLGDASWLVAPVLVLAGYASYLFVHTGSWSAWYSAQNQGWQRSLSWPWDGLKATIALTDPAHWPGRGEVPVMFALEIVAVGVGYLMLVACLVARSWGAAAFVAANVVALSSSGWFMSVNRAVLLWFPLFAGLGAMLTWRPRRGAPAWPLVAAVAVVADLVVQCWWSWCYFSGRWAS